MSRVSRVLSVTRVSRMLRMLRCQRNTHNMRRKGGISQRTGHLFFSTCFISATLNRSMSVSTAALPLFLYHGCLSK